MPKIKKDSSEIKRNFNTRRRQPHKLRKHQQRKIKSQKIFEDFVKSLKKDVYYNITELTSACNQFFELDPKI